MSNCSFFVLYPQNFPAFLKVAAEKCILKIYFYIKIYLEIDNFIKKIQLLENKDQFIYDYFNLKKLIFSNIARAYMKKENYEVSIRYDEAVKIIINKDNHNG